MRGCWYISIVISMILSAMKYSRVVDCLKWSCPAGAIWKNLQANRRVKWQLWIFFHLPRPKTRQHDAKFTAHPVSWQKDIQPLVNLASDDVDFILAKGSNETAQRLFLLHGLAHVGSDHPLYVPAKQGSARLTASQILAKVPDVPEYNSKKQTLDVPSCFVEPSCLLTIEISLHCGFDWDVHLHLPVSISISSKLSSIVVRVRSGKDLRKVPGVKSSKVESPDSSKNTASENAAKHLPQPVPCNFMIRIPLFRHKGAQWGQHHCLVFAGLNFSLSFFDMYLHLEPNPLALGGWACILWLEMIQTVHFWSKYRLQSKCINTPSKAPNAADPKHPWTQKGE